jgi:hypothetical protein
LAPSQFTKGILQSGERKGATVALKLVVNFKGYSAEYWKILHCDSNWAENKTKLVLALYKDKVARDANLKNFLDMKSMNFDQALEREEAYAEIKKQDLFKTAEDI